MADKKISALTGASTPLAGTEVLPIVQSSTTVKVSVDNLTAGRSFNALGMTLTSTDAGAAAAPLLELYRDSASPAASDTLGEIEFNGEDSAGNKQAYALFHGSILSPTSGSEQGQLHFETATAGVLTEKMIIGTTNLVINEIGAVFNVRIEGDTDANLFTTDATNSRVGVGTLSPAEKLDVVGKIKLSDNVVIGTSNKGIIDSTGVVTLAFNSGGTVLTGYQVTNTGAFSNVGTVQTLTIADGNGGYVVITGVQGGVGSSTSTVPFVKRGGSIAVGTASKAILTADPIASIAASAGDIAVTPLAGNTYITYAIYYTSLGA